MAKRKATVCNGSLGRIPALACIATLLPKVEEGLAFAAIAAGAPQGMAAGEAAAAAAAADQTVWGARLVGQ